MVRKSDFVKDMFTILFIFYCIPHNMALKSHAFLYTIPAFPYTVQYTLYCITQDKEKC